MSTGVSFPQYPPTRCVNCGAAYTPELYVIVDSSERPDLIERIKDDILHCAICPQCGVVMAFGMPLLVYRPGESVPVMYSPAPGANPAQREEHAIMLLSALRDRLGPKWSDRLERGVYMVDRDRLEVVVDCNPDLLPGGPDPSLRLAMDRYLYCDTWEEAQRAVEAYPVLLGREADIVLSDGARRMREAGDDPVAEAFMTEHLEVLRQCRAVGVRRAFAAKTDGSGRTLKPDLGDDG
ncbi:MAG TPA: CpXC domain-containing protein [Actinomycetes bacterium]|nr:CpXC domain-containing protein [Actinomycetes bacterium]